ncbi:MAG: DUF5818 domain-containing protein [Terriglobia bacterium]
MRNKLFMLGVAFLVSGCMAFAATTYSGTVSDSNCGVKHAHPSTAAAQCVAKCVSGGAQYVLVSKDKVYKLDSQDKFADYAGKYVRVKGTLNGDTIAVDSVEAPHHHGMAKPSGGM